MTTAVNVRLGEQVMEEEAEPLVVPLDNSLTDELETPEERPAVEVVEEVLEANIEENLQTPRCIVCFDERQEFIILPCGHLGVCNACRFGLGGRTTEELQNETEEESQRRPIPRCPYCRQGVTFTQVFAL